jgi:hypothetical protein
MACHGVAACVVCMAYGCARACVRACARVIACVRHPLLCCMHAPHSTCFRHVAWQLSARRSLPCADDRAPLPLSRVQFRTSPMLRKKIAVRVECLLFTFVLSHSPRCRTSHHHHEQVRVAFSLTKKEHSPTPGRYMGEPIRRGGESVQICACHSSHDLLDSAALTLLHSVVCGHSI